MNLFLFYLVVISCDYAGSPRIETVNSYDPQVATAYWVESSEGSESVWAVHQTQDEAIESCNNFLWWQTNESQILKNQ